MSAVASQVEEVKQMKTKTQNTCEHKFTYRDRQFLHFSMLPSEDFRCCVMVDAIDIGPVHSDHRPVESVIVTSVYSCCGL